jgi:hypothetical protein
MAYTDPNHPGCLAFRCPICRSSTFQTVSVRRKEGQPEYQTEFLQCTGCSVMFRDPVKFTRFEPAPAPTPTEAEQRRKATKLEHFYKGNGDR